MFASHRSILRPLTALALACLPAILHGADVASAPRPIGIPEISLLLRSGYTGDEVLRETAGRPLLAPLDDAAAHALRDAGADPKTIDALRATRPIASESEADAALRQQAQAQQLRLDAWAAAQHQMLETNKASVQTKLTARRQQTLGAAAGKLSGKLVSFANGGLRPYDEAALANKKIFLLYASALWCGPCRKLTPQLVEFYNKFAPAHPEFEMILISQDHTSYDMENYMRQDAMPWAALAWEHRAEQPDLIALGAKGIPRLVLIDGAGQVVADNIDEKGTYTDPQHVLDALVAYATPRAAGPAGSNGATAAR